MKARVRIPSPGDKPRTLDVSGPVVRLGRDPACEVHLDHPSYAKVSRLHARIEADPTGFVLVHLSGRNKTLLNDAPVDGSAAIRPGDSIRLGITGPLLEILSLEQPAASVAETAEEHALTAFAGDIHHALLRGSARADRFVVGKGGVIGRDKGGAQFLLDHPHVSRQHARLSVVRDRVVLADLQSANGTFVNGERITTADLEPGDRIDVGPFSLQFDGTALVSTSRANNVELVALGLTRAVPRKNDTPLTLLDDVNLVIHPREFVAVLGPSGSGKSTLLGILSGRAKPDGGGVSVNGRDLHGNFAAFKQDIVVVPQRDVLLDTLTVGQSLRYTAQLRLPPDTSKEDVDASVSDVLGVVGLEERRDVRIRMLSGGQLKRASLANELLSKPSLLFLDEVTSGLDEQTDQEMMVLFRLIAESGKTVVCVTHNLANVEGNCHLIVLLTEGGKLAFVGTPGEAKSHFGVVKLGDVYRRLAERHPEEWTEAFQKSPYFSRYVRDRMLVKAADQPRSRSASDSGQARTSLLRQALVLTRRYTAVWRGDLTALGAMLGQSLLVAALLVLVFGSLDKVADPRDRALRTVNLLFLLAVSSFWLGCNNAAKELVKERVLYARERDFNLRADSYHLSKLLVLLAIGVVQTSLLFVLVRGVCGPPGDFFRQWAILLLMVLAGTTLGLLISALALTEEVAIALVPVAVIPQIILAGVVAPLSGASQWLAKGVVSVYWGQRGLEALLPDKDRLPEMKQESLLLAVGFLLAHAAACSLATFLILRRRDPR